MALSEDLQQLVRLAENALGCDNCGKQSKNLISCQCLGVSYCSSTCQKKHWQCHKVLCAAGPQASASVGVKVLVNQHSILKVRKNSSKKMDVAPDVRDPEEIERIARELIEEEEQEKSGSAKGLKTRQQKKSCKSRKGNDSIDKNSEGKNKLHALRTTLSTSAPSIRYCCILIS